VTTYGPLWPGGGLLGRCVVRASEASPASTAQPSAVVVARRMEHIEDGAGCEGARGMALMWCDIKHLARPQDVRDAGDRKFEGAAK